MDFAKLNMLRVNASRIIFFGTRNMIWALRSSRPTRTYTYFVLGGEPQQIILGVYVDDCLAAFSSHEATDYYMERLGKQFPVSEITMDKPGLVISMKVKYDRAAEF